jgi:hypothetical protein
MNQACSRHPGGASLLNSPSQLKYFVELDRFGTESAGVMPALFTEHCQFNSKSKSYGG